MNNLLYNCLVRAAVGSVESMVERSAFILHQSREVYTTQGNFEKQTLPSTFVGLPPKKWATVLALNVMTRGTGHALGGLVEYATAPLSPFPKAAIYNLATMILSQTAMGAEEYLSEKINYDPQAQGLGFAAKVLENGHPTINDIAITKFTFSSVQYAVNCLSSIVLNNFFYPRTQVELKTQPVFSTTLNFPLKHFAAISTVGAGIACLRRSLSAFHKTNKDTQINDFIIQTIAPGLVGFGLITYGTSLYSNPVYH